MIPSSGCDPEINVVSIGAKILEKLLDGCLTLEEIMSCCSTELNVSIDHIILSLDWLFSIKAINYDGSEVFINEAK
jgi:hypothetical protein